MPASRVRNQDSGRFDLGARFLATDIQGAWGDDPARIQFQALGTYGKLTTLRPRDGQMWLLYAFAAQSAGKTDNALKAYKTFLKLSPDAPEAAQVKAQIKSLQQTSNGVVSSGGVTRINR